MRRTKRGQKCLRHIKTMTRPLFFNLMWTALLFCLLHCAGNAVSGADDKPKFGDTERLHEWVSLDYDWPSKAAKEKAIEDKHYIPENNVPTGVKWYKNQLYVCVARWFSGVPSTMNKLIVKDGKSLMQAFPSWEMQKIDDCDMLQYAMSMDIDPNTGYMWIIDVGRRNLWEETPVNNCPPKIVILDINTKKVVSRYVFPDYVVSRTGNFLNDIAIDPEGGYAYITDSGVGPTGFKGGVVVYDHNAKSSFRVEHASMLVEPGGGNLTINGIEYYLPIPSCGVTLSPDKTQVFYSSIGGYHLYQIPTGVLLQKPDQALMEKSIRDLGRKTSQNDGLMMGHNGVYYGALTLNAVYMWDSVKDSKKQKVGLDTVSFSTKVQVTKDDQNMIYPDSFAFDDSGWLYFIQKNLLKFKLKQLTNTSGKPNFGLYRVFVDDSSYLQKPRSEPAFGSVERLYNWVSVDYDWPTEGLRSTAVQDKTYVPENNIITGIKWYKREIYISVARWFLGVPSTLNKLVIVRGKPVLQAFPNWELQQIDDCDMLQYAMSMDIDPNTGNMWIIDVGRRNIWGKNPVNVCPPKIVILNINTKKVVSRYDFPADVVSRTGNFLNDIAIDPEGGYAYITDSGVGPTGSKGGVVVYDHNAKSSFRVEHASMMVEPGGGNLTINGIKYYFPIPSVGIALSPDKTQVFYSSVGGYHLNQIPAAILSEKPDAALVEKSVRDLGRKISQNDGLLMGHKGMYFGALALNAMYMWDYVKDMKEQDVGLGEVKVETEVEVAQDNENMVWPDSFSFNDDGWLYFAQKNLPKFKGKQLNMTGEDANFILYRVYVADSSYLQEEPDNPEPETGEKPTSRGCSTAVLYLGVLCLAGLMHVV